MLSTWRMTGRLPRWPTWFTKELSDVVRSHLAVHHVGLLLYRLVYHLVQNHPKHHLTLSRCHKYSQAIWRSSVGLLWSPVVFISQKSVFSETPCNLTNPSPKHSFQGVNVSKNSVFFLHFSLLNCPKPTLAGHWYSGCNKKTLFCDMNTTGDSSRPTKLLQLV